MDEYEFECYVKAGKIASSVKKFCSEIVKDGVKLLYIAESVEGKIRELGGDVAFPVNLSIDEIAAHYTPIPNDDKVASGLLKIDIGVCVDGFIADFAVCFDLTDDGKYGEMIKLNKKVLQSVMDFANVDMVVKDVGEIATGVLEEFNDENDTNYNLIHSLCGHGVDKDTIHTGLIIPNHKNNSNKNLKNMAFAVEPFVTTGIGDIYEGGGGNIYCIKRISSVRDRDARDVLKYILENYKSRPFCERWLKDAGFKKTRFVLNLLEKQGVFYHYPMLIEKTKGVVSQVENSFVIFGEKVVCFTE